VDTKCSTVARQQTKLLASEGGCTPTNTNEASEFSLKERR
jgi:hypothetical protein